METVTIQKEVFEHFVVDLEKLLADFEHILDASLQMESETRLHEMKNDEIKSLTEDDYKKFIKKMGIKDD